MTIDVPPTGLPIEDVVGEVRDAMADSRLAVVRAEPGAGKSTVLPLRLLDEAWLTERRIVMLQPRRVAARATAARMASLLGEDVGQTVGYRVRGDRRVGRTTRLEVVTEGMLTRRLQNDPELGDVGLVIFDEVHERNLQTDLALALTLDVRRGLRPDLGVLAMSATIDVARLCELLAVDGRPVTIIEAKGRSFPVEVRWRPAVPDARRPARRGRDEAAAVAGVVREALSSSSGDVLVFLAGAGEIRRVQRELTSTPLGDVDVRPLFGGLSGADQDAALRPSPTGRRRVVVSTDIAETSLTVPGVTAVVDAGLCRRPHFDTRSGLTRLETRRTSRASADQRAGRAGRVEPGVAYRMWDEREHSRRDLFGRPEILAVDLAGLALELAVWGATPEGLSFLDTPPEGRYSEATDLLGTLGAIDRHGRPTPAGRAMAELPLHPRLAHMVVACASTSDAWLACAIASLLAERDVLSGPPDSVPADLAERVRLVTGDAPRQRGSDDRGVAAVLRNARDLARRIGVRPAVVELSACGVVLGMAYPDRIAQARGGGRFRLRSGRGATLSRGDALHAEEFLVVAELSSAPGATSSGSGDAGDDRIRIAAALDRRDLERIAAADIVEETVLEWDGRKDDLVALTTRRVDAVILSSSGAAPAPGPAVATALVEKVRTTGLGLVGWGPRARLLQRQAGFARAHLGDDWPDVSDAALMEALDDWLPPLLVVARGRADLAKVDMVAVIRNLLGHRRVATLDEIAPRSVPVPSGRDVPIDYSTDPPSISVRVQEMFGSGSHPTVAAGRVPLTVHLLSPAQRPVQVTADLPGFWSGSWAEVRKDMAGRYPKHDWPADPASAEPSTRARRGR